MRTKECMRFLEITIFAWARSKSRGRLIGRASSFCATGTRNCAAPVKNVFSRELTIFDIARIWAGPCAASPEAHPRYCCHTIRESLAQPRNAESDWFFLDTLMAVKCACRL